MEQKCCITGVLVEDSEGVLWPQIRPSIQEFLKTVRAGWSDDSFVSHAAMRDMMRTYITRRTDEEDQLQLLSQKKIKIDFTEEKSLEDFNFGGNDKPPSLGERMADKIADFGGSWKFISIFVGFMMFWIVVNAAFLGKKAVDPYPFILLNLMLSCLAALQAPIIMMSQNRQEHKDRVNAEYDFKVNVKAETEIRTLHEKLDHLLSYQHRNIDELFQLQLDIMQMMQQRIDALAQTGDKKPD